MSWLSSITGIGINPLGKTKVKIDPVKALGTALTVGSMGGLGPVAGALGRIPGVAAGAAKVGGVLSKVPGATKVGGYLLNGFGKAGQAQPSGNGGGYNAEDPNQNIFADPSGAASGAQATAPTDSGNWLSSLGGFLSKPGVAQAGADVIGGVLQGQAAAAQNQQQAQQFNRTQGLEEANSALGASRQAATAPLRDQAIYGLQQRMGMQQGQFQPHDIYNQSYGNGPAKLGGIDEQELQRRLAGYRPGAGGVNSALLNAYVQKYGGLK